MPSGTAFIAFCAFTQIISAMVLANSFGIIALLVDQLNEKSRKFQEQVDLANTAMQNINLSKDLIKEVIFFVLTT